MIELLKKNVADAHDNLLLAKILQASCANERRGVEVEYKVGDQVMLSMANRRRDFKQRGDGRVAKFMLHYDGLYSVIVARPVIRSHHLWPRKLQNHTIPVNLEAIRTTMIAILRLQSSSTLHCIWLAT